VSDDAKREALMHQMKWTGHDSEKSHEIYHEDAVLEFPQSGERFVGKQTFQAWREKYPADVKFKVRRISGSGDFWVGEQLASYNGGPWMFGVSLHQFRGDKVALERIYVMEGFDAAAWRSEWAEMFDPLASVAL
jgi:hypothetical protein